MVDVDKQACHNLAERGYRSSLWPESYVTWDFLDRYPKSMEPGYLHLNWNHIPRMYLRKNYMRTLVIEKRDWNHLTDPASLVHYWEPSQGNEDFHRTFALALCKTIYHDCAEAFWRKEYVVSVAVVQKLALYAAIPFSNAIDEFEDDLEPSPTLLLVDSIGICSCFQICTSNSIPSILRSLTIPGRPTMLAIPRSSWLPCSTTIQGWG